MDDLLDLLAEELGKFHGLALKIEANRVRRLLDTLHPLAPAAPLPSSAVEPMPYGESIAFGKTTLGYGIHAARPINEIDYAYLAWLADAKRDEARALTRYLKRRELEGQD